MFIMESQHKHCKVSSLLVRVLTCFYMSTLPSHSIPKPLKDGVSISSLRPRDPALIPTDCFVLYQASFQNAMATPGHSHFQMTFQWVEHYSRVLARICSCIGLIIFLFVSISPNYKHLDHPNSHNYYYHLIPLYFQYSYVSKVSYHYMLRYSSILLIFFVFGVTKPTNNPLRFKYSIYHV